MQLGSEWGDDGGLLALGIRGADPV